MQERRTHIHTNLLYHGHAPTFYAPYLHNNSIEHETSNHGIFYQSEAQAPARHEHGCLNHACQMENEHRSCLSM